MQQDKLILRQPVTLQVKVKLGDVEAGLETEGDTVLHLSGASNAAAGWRRAAGLATASLSSGGRTSSGGETTMSPTSL